MMRILVALAVCSTASDLVGQIATFGQAQVLNLASRSLAADLDGDGDLDVLSRSEVALEWRTNDGAGTFGPAQLIATGPFSADSVEVEDVDGDGDLDVMAGSAVSTEVSWYANDGAGTFGPPQSVAVGGIARLFCADDLDGDGDVDLVFQHSGGGVFSNWGQPNCWGGGVSVCKNDGAGTFGPPLQLMTAPPVPPSYTFFSFEVADMDGDGDLDVMTVESDSTYGSAVYWYPNDGTGSFGPKRDVAPVVLLSPVRAGHCIADVDGDGDSDVVLCGESTPPMSRRLHWCENQGNGAFGALHTLARDAFEWVMAVDLDADGDLDLLSGGGFMPAGGDPHAGGPFYMLNDGTGWFGPSERLLDFKLTPPAPNTMLGCAWDVPAVVEDLDRDGDLDVLWYGAIYPNHGPGRFGSQQAVYTWSGNNSPAPLWATAADVDGDGDEDLLWTASVGSWPAVPGTDVWLQANLGAASFGPPTHVCTLPGWFSRLQCGDVDGDGDQDLFSVNASYEFVWAANDGAGAFAAEPSTLSMPGARQDSLFAADMDADGDLDMVSGKYGYSGGTGGLLIGTDVYFNDGTGVFALSQDNNPIGSLCRLVADMDADGDLDVVARPAGSLDLVWHANDGKGGLGPAQHITTLAGAVAAGDLNGDGAADVCLVTGWPPSAVQWLANDGTGSFGPALPLEHDVPPFDHVAVTDADGDGDPDVVVGYEESPFYGSYSAPHYQGHLAYYENVGPGSFGPRQLISTAAVGGFGFEVRDLDQDGDPEIFAVGGTPSTTGPTDGPVPAVVLYLGLSADTASSASPYGAGCGQPAMTFTPTSRAILGQSLSALVTNTPTPYCLVSMGCSDATMAGVGPLPFDLGQVGMTGCWLYQSADVFGFATTPGAQFEASFSMALPNDPQLSGQHAYFQAFSVAPGANAVGVVASNGIDFRLGTL